MDWKVTLPDGEGILCRGHIIDPVARTVTDGEICVRHGRIAAISPLPALPADAPYWLPGFIDAHVHVESSMMLPAEFARAAMRHGTVGAVCDPHEIANVLGIGGIDLMLQSAAQTSFHFLFGAPSCVPSCGSAIETGGAVISAADIARLMQRPDIGFLGEMMNYPGVLAADPEVMAKIQAALDAGKPVDGHAPGLVGDARRRYAAAGIATDHECGSLQEGRDAIAAGQYVLIRQGSAAKDFATLAPLIAEAPDRVMFCTDDSHPGDLLADHISRHVRLALAEGYDVMDILQAATVNAVRHYRLPVGLMQVGDSADIICLSDLTPQFRVVATSTPSAPSEHLPLYGETVRMEAAPLTPQDIASPVSLPIEGEVARSAGGGAHIIVATDGSLLTDHEVGPIGEGVQKLVVYNRYTPGVRPAVGYIRGFNLRCGAMAQTIAHDCHNIVAVGTSDALIADAVNRLIDLGGGIVVNDGTALHSLPLPIGGLMSGLPCEQIAEAEAQLRRTVKAMGCTLHAPFITLAFMALPVIPRLKLTDRGLFNGDTFRFVDDEEPVE